MTAEPPKGELPDVMNDQQTLPDGQKREDHLLPEQPSREGAVELPNHWARGPNREEVIQRLVASNELTRRRREPVGITKKELRDQVNRLHDLLSRGAGLVLQGDWEGLDAWVVDVRGVVSPDWPRR